MVSTSLIDNASICADAEGEAAHALALASHSLLAMAGGSAAAAAAAATVLVIYLVPHNKSIGEVVLTVVLTVGLTVALTITVAFPLFSISSTSRLSRQLSPVPRLHERFRVSSSEPLLSLPINIRSRCTGSPLQLPPFDAGLELSLVVSTDSSESLC